MGFFGFFKSVGKAIGNVAKKAGKAILPVLRKVGRVSQVLTPVLAIGAAIPGLNLLAGPALAAVGGIAALETATEAGEFVAAGGLKHV